MTDKNLVNHLSVQQYIFWDFDGVIKDSVEVKSSAFEQLFKTFGVNVANKVKCHHEANSGISRFDKLPIYLEWSGQHPTQALIQCYSEKFSRLVKQKVIESEWVPGVLNYLEINSKNQIFFLITATPQAEIEEILNISYLLKITKLIIIILNMSYLLSMFWYIMCKLEEDYHDKSPYKYYFNDDYEP